MQLGTNDNTNRKELTGTSHWVPSSDDPSLSSRRARAAEGTRRSDDPIAGLVIDFSSNPFVAAEMKDSGEMIVLGSVQVDAEVSIGSAVHRVPSLRKNLPHIVNPKLRSLCWRSILQSVAALAPDFSVPMHAILPQTWRWQESCEFQEALTEICATSRIESAGSAPQFSPGLEAWETSPPSQSHKPWRGGTSFFSHRGHLLSETICIAGILAPLLKQLREKQKREPLRLLVVYGESDGCRHWSFDLFTSVSPTLLRLREYAPSWCAYPRLPDVPETDAAIVTGDRGAASRELDHAGFSGERLNGDSILNGACCVLKSLKDQAWSMEELRLEMAPALGWRLGKDAPEPVVEAGTLLDPANFPWPQPVKCEWTLTSYTENSGELSFGLEAGWGSLPESWTPLASVQVPRAWFSEVNQQRPAKTVTMVIDMPNPCGGVISAQVFGMPAATSSCAEFKLLSAAI